jgi:hypothetical protein
MTTVDDEDSQQDKPLSSESDESDSEDDVTYDTKPGQWNILTHVSSTMC